MKNDKLKASGKDVAADVVKLARDTGTLIYELYSYVASLIKSALEKNAAKKAEQTSPAEKATVK